MLQVLYRRHKLLFVFLLSNRSQIIAFADDRLLHKQLNILKKLLFYRNFVFYLICNIFLIIFLFSLQNHDKWKYPVNNKMATPTNSMSYMGPSTAMPGLYDMSQNKSIPPEQLIYLSGQMPGGVSLHPQYLQQSMAHQLPMRQGAVSTFLAFHKCETWKGRKYDDVKRKYLFFCFQNFQQLNGFETVIIINRSCKCDYWLHFGNLEQQFLSSNKVNFL